MKKKVLVSAITLSLLFSVTLTAVGGKAMDGEEIDQENIVETETEAAKEIHDWYDLNNIRENLTADYVLMSDLDENTSGYDELVDTSDGWDPIGSYDYHDDVEFNGSFYGGNHEISDLYIDRSGTDYVGLFGGTNKGVEIKNVGLVNVDISGMEAVGGFVGVNYGLVKNSYVTGKIKGHWAAGGLVGVNEGDVKKSYASVDVSGGEESWGIGGLVGAHLGTIENSYATGDVSGKESVGGLVGDNDHGTISRSYAVGEVSGSLFEEVIPGGTVGGVVGSNEGGVNNCYWDVETSGTEDSEGGTGLKTEKMTGEDAKNNMNGFDFEDTWETVEEQHENATEDGYPILQNISREKQLQHVYPAEPVDKLIPGFTSTLLLIAGVTAVAIYRRKKR